MVELYNKKYFDISNLITVFMKEKWDYRGELIKM